jgi:HPr kinase/phosphorylase
MVLRNMIQQITVQGVLVAVHGVGTLIRGAPGSGKSAAALALMRRGHRLVADDLVKVSAGQSGEPIGEPLEARVHIEVRGLGVFPAELLLPGATTAFSRIDLVVDLDGYDPGTDAGRITPQTSRTTVLGHELPAVRVPLTTGMDTALVIEFVARLHKQNALVSA